MALRLERLAREFIRRTAGLEAEALEQRKWRALRQDRNIEPASLQDHIMRQVLLADGHACCRPGVEVSCWAVLMMAAVVLPILLGSARTNRP